MEKLLPEDIYSIDDTPTRLVEGKGKKHILYDAGKKLEDLNVYEIVDTEHRLVEEATLRDYDGRFAAKLCAYQKVQDTPPYLFFRSFLEYHYRMAKKKTAYLDHISKEIIPRYRYYFEALPAEYFQEIIGWIDEHSNQRKPIRGSLIRQAAICLIWLEWEGKEEFASQKKHIIEFVKNNFTNPETGKPLSGKNVYECYNDLNHLDKDKMKKQYDLDYNEAMISVMRFT